MVQPRISYENIGRVLECIKLIRGNQKFRTWDYFEPVYVALYPEDEDRLKDEGGQSVRQTIAGRLFDYFKNENGTKGPRIERLSPVPESNAEYKIVS